MKDKELRAQLLRLIAERQPINTASLQAALPGVTKTAVRDVLGALSLEGYVRAYNGYRLIKHREEPEPEPPPPIVMAVRRSTFIAPPSMARLMAGR